MRSRFYCLKPALIAMLGTATFCFGGEKIEFSAPSEKTESTPRTRELPKGKSSILDSFNRGTPEFTATPLPQAMPERQGGDSKKKEKDWLFGKPDEAPALNELFKSAEPDVRTEDAKANNFLPDLNSNTDSSESALGKSNSRFPDPANANTRGKSEFDLRPKWEQGASFSERRSLSGQSGTVTDFLKDREAQRDRFSTHALERRSEYEQLFQTRTGEPMAGFVDKTRLPANPTIAMPDDLLSRPNQTGLSQSWKESGAPLIGGRISTQDDLNPRAVSRGATAFENTQEIRAKPQPTVLPFPNRPGQIFTRPGNF